MLDSQLIILHQALGFDQYGQLQSDRNHFVTCFGGLEYLQCQDLVLKGLMKIHPMSKTLTGKNDCFVVTQKGVDLVELKRPKKQMARKLTKGEKNFIEYMDSDCDFPFSEWLKLRKRSAKTK